MLNMKTGILAVVAAGAAIMAGTALASVPNDQSDSSRSVRGRCEFKAFYDAGKGGTYMSTCQARFRADLRSDGGDGWAGADEGGGSGHRERFLEVSCDGQEIYADGVRARVLDGDDHGHDDDFAEVLVTGRGDDSPRILLEGVELKDRDGHDGDRRTPSVLKYELNGVKYRLEGRCELEKDEQGPPPVVVH